MIYSKNTSNPTISTLAQHAALLILSDFPFADPNDSPANTLANVIITSLTQPSGSLLTLNRSAVALNTPIAASEIAAGHLVFTHVNPPADNGHGTNYCSVSDEVHDIC